MINAKYIGVSEFTATLQDIGGLPFPFYYLILTNPQTKRVHVLELNVVGSNDRGQACELTQLQKEDLRQGRYEYVIRGEETETEEPTGKIVEEGFFQFTDTRTDKQFYK